MDEGLTMDDITLAFNGLDEEDQFEIHSLARKLSEHVPYLSYQGAVEALAKIGVAIVKDDEGE